MAGHSKWANIKHRKGRQDEKRQKVFSKLIRELTVAAKLGGSEPGDNPRLRLALDKALAANMPKDTIERAVARGSGDQESENLEETIYEGYGPNGVAIIVETLTDNKNRTVAEVRHAFSKFGGSLGTDGSVSYLFTKIGQIVVESNNEEKIFDLSVSNGAEEVEKGEDNNFIISVEVEEFHNLKQVLEDNEIKITEYELLMRASNSIELDVESSEKVINLLENLEDLDDVQGVHSNAEFSEGSFS